MNLPPGLLRPAVRQLQRHVLNPSLPWETQRSRLDAFMRASPPARGSKVSSRDLAGIRADVVTAGPGSRAGAVGQGAAAVGRGSPAGTVLHFHGGGYCVGSAAMARSWAAAVSARTGCQVVLPEYRLAPEHPHPAALDDARAVLKALASSEATGPIVLSGDSAGGGLALALLLALRAEGQPLPAGCVLLSPWLDLGQDRRADHRLVRKDLLLSPAWLAACVKAYAGSNSLTDPALSPLLADHHGLPPLLIQAGTDELLAPDSSRLAASAAGAGVDVTYTRWPGMWHDFALQPGQLAAANSAVDQVAWFVAKLAPPRFAG
jgi:epsilon-lactone hydrolase